MSFSTRSYSKESRSSSHYSRSASYHSGYNSSYHHQKLNDDRPLSTRLIERDSSWPTLTWNLDINDPFYFDRLRWRFDNNFLKWNYGLGRSIPIYHRSWNNSSSTRVIPIQYSPSSPRINRRHRSNKSSDDELSSSSIKHHDENSIRRENRLPSDEWPASPEPSTRKRTSMTILVRRPYIDQSEVPYYRQTLPTPVYPQSVRTDYY